MGKPTKDHDEPVSDAVPSQGHPGPSSSVTPYLDNDAPEINIDDLPPAYDDAVDSSEAAPMLPSNSGASDSVRPVDFDAKIVIDKESRAQAWVAKSVEDPVHLETYINKLSALPPRPYMQIVGTHSESARDRKGREERRTVTDFDISVDLTPYLYANAQYRTSWMHLRTVEDSEKVRRGTVLRKRGNGANLSAEMGNGGKPTLQEWCHRFAASPAPFKCFTLQRKVVGLDEEGLKKRLVALVRGTNYYGQLKVQLVTKDARIDFYNDNKVNRWRLTIWIRWLFFLSLMFILSWPFLFFQTKRWEVVTIEWPFSRVDESGGREYVSITEEQWYNLWARVIFQAVLEKKQAILDQADIRRAHEGQSINTGNTFNGGLGIFRASVFAMNQVNRQLGWGQDS
ncbi:hypothetical protein GGR50DRAFT_697198 [Xylaria sp. CBS 124048]|nr:hypothetical protein GGR50DRAFT_697198 [Xylaria sp. CBS 124048]